MAELKSTPISIAEFKVKNWDASIRKRNTSYYSLKNAITLVPVLDEIITTRQSQRIDCTDSINAHTLNMRITQGWRFIMDYAEKVAVCMDLPVTNVKRWEVLRGVCIVRECHGYCEIVYCPSNSVHAWKKRKKVEKDSIPEIAADGTKALARSNIRWDEKVSKWITTPRLQIEPLILDGLSLSEDELIKAQSALNRVSDKFDITITSRSIDIRIRK